MIRFQIFFSIALMVFICGCEPPEQTPGPPPTGPVEEPKQADQQQEAAAEQENSSDESAKQGEASPEPGDTAEGGEESAPEAGDTAPSAEGNACPEAREPQGMCAQVITWAKNPESGKCCQYPSPCHAPEGWKTFGNEEQCEK